jgi:hypothetical protein
MVMTNPHGEADSTKVFSSKYAGEAANVASLLEKPNTTDAAQRLALDAQIAPHEMHAFLKQVQGAYAADKAKDPHLPDLICVDDKSGIKIAVKKDGSQEATTVFERKAEDIAKVGDKPIPMTGELLGLSADDTKKVLAVQAAEKQAGKGTHYFGDIAVSLGLKTPEEVNAALNKQDHLKAQQQADDLSKSMPIAKGEGYYQMLKRTHPDLSDHDASQLAYMIKKLHHNESVLKVGDQLPVLNDKDKARLEETIYQQLHKKTGSVQAKPNQPLSEIPTH